MTLASHLSNVCNTHTLEWILQYSIAHDSFLFDFFFELLKISKNSFKEKYNK